MILAIDIGGTNIKVGIGENGAEVKLHSHAKTTTPQDYEAGLQAVKELAQQQLGGGVPETIVLGIAGIMDKNHEVLVNAPNLPDWSGKNFKEDLENLFQAKVAIHNDALLAGTAEAVLGSGRGANVVGYVGIGTGVGGVKITAGQPEIYVSGSEPGHQLIQLNDEWVEWEDLIASAGIKAHEGKDPNEIDDVEFWDNVAKITAVGLHNLALVWSPDVLIVGGGMVTNNLIPWEKVVNNYLDLSKKAVFTLPSLVQATLGETSGLLGGILMA